MRAIEVSTYGGPDALVEVQRSEPDAAAGRVRVRVAAATVNPVDIAIRAGAMAARVDATKPIVLGWDVAGTTIDEAAGLPAGSRVVGMIPWFANGDGRGAYAEVVSLDRSWLALVPGDVPSAEAATLPLNGLTASQALGLLDLQPGQTLLVTGPSGGVGGFAVQLAAAAGVHVAAIASADDATYVAKLGASTVIERASADRITEAVRAAFPGGVDAVLDGAQIGAPVLAGVRDGGRFVAVVPPAAPQPERGIEVRAVEVHPDQAELARLADLLASGRLVTRVATTVPLADAASAHRLVEAGGLRGKVVLVN